MTAVYNIFDSASLNYERWADCDASRIEDNSSYIISVYRDKLTLSKLFLAMQKSQSGPLLCFIPLSKEVEAVMNESKIMLTFTKYNNISVIFSILSTQSFEMILSEICIGIFESNTQTDKYRSQNIMFLDTIKSDSTIVSSIRENKKYVQVGKSFSYMSPIVTSNNHLRIWKDRIYSMNSGFVTEERELRITFLTWNVASVHPKVTVLEDINNAFTNGAAKSDIIFIALQEIDMGVVSVVAGSSKKVKDQWSKIIHLAVIHQNGEYTIVAESNLGGVFAALIFRHNLIPAPICGDVKTIRLGAHGFAANKGAIIFPFNVGAARFIFMGCHLTAGASSDKLDERNQQLRQLMRLVGGNYDYLVIIGDLNYRIDLTYEKCIEYIDANNISELLQRDQLRQSKKKDPNLSLLKEPDQTFMPTYKFDQDSDIYDTSPKHRVPSYTDRILVRRGRKRIAVGNMRSPVFNLINKPELNFPSMPICVDFFRGKCKFSDHRSVLCAYKFKIPLVSDEKLGLLDKETNEKVQEVKHAMIPSARFDPPSILVNNNSPFPQTFNIAIENIRSAWVDWHTNKIPEVELSPSRGLLLPRRTQKLVLTLTKPIQTVTVTASIINGDNATIVLTSDPNSASASNLSQSQSQQIPIQNQSQQQLSNTQQKPLPMPSYRPMAAYPMSLQPKKILSTKPQFGPGDYSSMMPQRQQQQKKDGDDDDNDNLISL